MVCNQIKWYFYIHFLAIHLVCVVLFSHNFVQKSVDTDNDCTWASVRFNQMKFLWCSTKSYYSTFLLLSSSNVNTLMHLSIVSFYYFFGWRKKERERAKLHPFAARLRQFIIGTWLWNRQELNALNEMSEEKVSKM